MDIAQFALAGFGVGILVGLTGMGGGSIVAPLLILVFRVQPVVAVGTDLVYMAVTKFFGAWQHHRLGNVDYRLAGLLALGSIPGALLGLLLLALWSDNRGFSSDTLITRMLAAVLLLVGASLLFFRKTLAAPSHSRPSRPLLVPVLGAIVGFLVALTSVGSGALFLLLIIALYALPMKRVVGTDIFHGVVLVSVAGMGHMFIGNVDYAIAGSLLLGSVPGVIVGSKLTAILSEKKLATSVGLVLLGVGARLLL